ncbi:DUF3290 domain-containing protein [Lactococcus muris]|uniref:DUF3290 domain-containing protein n=2 Tax=Lactococcus TaxID=1357 RepID=A0ABV4DCB4_9LACT|nr:MULTISPECIES: DUF3290 domain-containing protein [Lactococcus]MBL3716690.1 DUF3290 family protein [Lactococcus garvieae]
MNFYDIEFLKSQSGINDYIRYIFIFASLTVLVIIFSIYIRHKIKTKYRDLSIILLLFIILELGIQYSNYIGFQSKQNQSSQMVAFIENVAKNQKVDIDKVLVNSTQFADGIIVKIDDKYYSVNLNPDQKTYTFVESYLINPQNNEMKK